MNKLRGEISVDIAGRRAVLQFTVDALASLEADTGRPVIELIRELSTGAVRLSTVLAFATAGLTRHPDIVATLYGMPPGALLAIGPQIGAALEAAFPASKQVEKINTADTDAKGLDWFELQQAYIRSGFDPEGFWDLTPREIGVRLDAANERRKTACNDLIAQAWLTASLSRAQRIPRLEKLISSDRRKPARRQTWQEQLALMQAWAAAHNARYGEGAVVEGVERAPEPAEAT